MSALAAPLRRPCGGLSLALMGEPAVLRCSGALWLPARRTLVASDLHLEKGSAFARRGQMLPPYDSPATLAKLEAEIAELAPARVVLLGDSFHDAAAVGRMNAADLAWLARLAEGRDWVWIEGNHDIAALAETLDALPGRVAETLSLGPLTLIHEPQPGVRDGEVAGHLHPAARVIAYARAVRRPCFVTDGRRLVLPAFGAFTGGLDIRHAAFAGLFATRPLLAALGRDRVHALRWDAVG